MDIFFADDARQQAPSRAGMGPLVAAGGIYVPEAEFRNLETAPDELCTEFGFPPKEEFKWSPGRELWMRTNLVKNRRAEFFVRALRLAHGRGVRGVVVIEDTKYRTASNAQTAEDDVTLLLMERVHTLFRGKATGGILIADRPGGDRRAEERFLAKCLETMRAGTKYVKLVSIVLTVSTPSKLIRLLHLADVVTSCITAVVGGETQFAPPVFAEIRPLLHSDGTRVGGMV